MPKTVDPILDDLVREFTNQGKSAATIADRLHVCTRTVVRARRRVGVAGLHVAPYSESIRERARIFLEDGASAEEVGRTLGVSGRTVRHWFPDKKWTPRQISEYGNLQRWQINELAKGKQS